MWNRGTARTLKICLKQSKVKYIVPSLFRLLANRAIFPLRVLTDGAPGDRAVKAEFEKSRRLRQGRLLERYRTVRQPCLVTLEFVQRANLL